jgi:hypothetical protein
MGEKKKNKQSSSAVLPPGFWEAGWPDKSGEKMKRKRFLELKRKQIFGCGSDDERAEALRAVSVSVGGRWTKEEMGEQLDMACAPGKRFPLPSDTLEAPYLFYSHGKKQKHFSLVFSARGMLASARQK